MVLTAGTWRGCIARLDLGGLAMFQYMVHGCVCIVRREFHTVLSVYSGQVAILEFSVTDVHSSKSHSYVLKSVDSHIGLRGYIQTS